MIYFLYINKFCTLGQKTCQIFDEILPGFTQTILLFECNAIFYEQIILRSKSSSGEGVDYRENLMVSSNIIQFKLILTAH